jgi:hypothetical protein
MFTEMIDAAKKADISPAYIYAMRKTGRIVTERKSSSYPRRTRLSGKRQSRSSGLSIERLNATVVLLLAFSLSLKDRCTLWQSRSKIEELHSILKTTVSGVALTA